METIKTLSTSKRTATLTDLVLRKTQTTRLIFRPLVVDNIHNQEACIKGWFIFQKKGLKDKWDDIKTLDLSKLKKEEWIKLELKAEEVLKLLQNFNYYKEIYKKYGITYGLAEFHITDKNIGETVKKLSKFPNKDLLLQSLQDLSKENFQNLHAIINASQLSKVISIWQGNKSNKSESFWKETFKEYAWVISQIFACPYIFIGDEYYYGGKRSDNKGGVHGDFLYKNKLTGNAAFIEIKTPMTKIIARKYRGDNDLDHNTVYSCSDDLSGGVVQVLNQRKVFQQKQDSLEENKVSILNAKCVLVVGKSGDLTPGQKKSFDLFRNNIKDVEIITYDELFERIKALKKVFSY
jgi:hypothetical protein